MCEWMSDWINSLIYSWNYGGHLRSMVICQVIIIACAILQVLIVVYHTVSFFTSKEQESEEGK